MTLMAELAWEAVEETKRNALEIAKRWLADTHDDETPLSAIVVSGLVARVEQLEVLKDNELGARLELQAQRDAAVAILRVVGEGTDLGWKSGIQNALAALGADNAKEEQS